MTIEGIRIPIPGNTLRRALLQVADAAQARAVAADASAAETREQGPYSTATASLVDRAIIERARADACRGLARHINDSDLYLLSYDDLEEARITFLLDEASL